MKNIEFEDIYKEIAEKYGVSVEEVKRDMQEAIDMAYINPTFQAKCLPYKNKSPTTEEFIKHMIDRLGGKL